MAESPKPDQSGFVFVKGGTSTSTYDNEMARRRDDARKRRDHEDRVADIASRGIRPGEAARLGEQRFVNQSTPMLVLFYMNRDGTVRQEAISEITMMEGGKQGELDLMFTLVCPRCVERGVPQGESQMMVRNSHRPFELHEDERAVRFGVEVRKFKKGQTVMVPHPFAPLTQIAIIIAGTVWCKDTVRCDNYNCNYAVRIEGSQVVEV